MSLPRVLFSFIGKEPSDVTSRASSAADRWTANSVASNTQHLLAAEVNLGTAAHVSSVPETVEIANIDRKLSNAYPQQFCPEGSHVIRDGSNGSL